MIDEQDKTYRVVKHDIEQYLSVLGSESFTQNQVDSQFNFRSREAKNYRWHILENLVPKGILQRLGTGKYRKIDTSLEELHWQSADLENTINLARPLNLHRYIKTWHKSIEIIAGAPGAGKTAYLYDLVLRNMGNPMGIVIFTNDMTVEEIKERMCKSDFEIPTPAPFKMWDKADNFSDVIEPDKINIIDYLDLNSEVYLVGDEIERIYQKLKEGIAIIGLQKKPGQTLAIGGIFTIKRAKLYISLDSIKESGQWLHKLTIQKARGRTDPTIDPRTIEIKFKLVNGIQFIPISSTKPIEDDVEGQDEIPF